jgi:hypothetical protein
MRLVRSEAFFRPFFRPAFFQITAFVTALLGLTPTMSSSERLISEEVRDGE